MVGRRSPRAKSSPSLAANAERTRTETTERSRSGCTTPVRRVVQRGRRGRRLRRKGADRAAGAGPASGALGAEKVGDSLVHAPVANEVPVVESGKVALRRSVEPGDPRAALVLELVPVDDE